jgi:hypothetical protein
MTEQVEFKFFGLTIPKLTMGYGLLLIAWGASFSVGSDSITSWIPAFVGLPIFVSGLLCVLRPNKKKIWIHIAVSFGLLAFLGGFRFFAALGSEAGLFGSPKAAASQLMLLVTGGVYTWVCVRSFIAARKDT